MILDGTQRREALLPLEAEGWTVPPLPVIYIHAVDEKEARTILLSISSQYGEWVEEELAAWLAGVDAEIAKTLRLVDKEIRIEIDKVETEKDTENENILKKQITQYGDGWTIDKKIKLYCDNSSGKSTDCDLLFFDPMFDDENVYSHLPVHQEGKKLLLFYDLIRCGQSIHAAMLKSWPFNFEFILDGCTSWVKKDLADFYPEYLTDDEKNPDKWQAIPW